MITDDGRERIDLPNGSSIWYRDSDHSYWLHNPKTGKPGRRIAGVTSIVKTLDFEPDGLMRWAAALELVGAARALADMPDLLDGLADADDPKAAGYEVHEVLCGLGQSYKDVRQKAADEGIDIHARAFEALAAGRAVPDTSAMSDEAKAKARAVQQFWFDHSPDPIAVEQVVFSETLRVAGRLDFLGRIDGRDGVGVIDLKTGNHLSIGHHAQVGGGYPLLVEESGFATVDWAAILHVHDDGTYDLVEARGSRDGFRLAAMTYREAKRIDRERKK